MNLPNDNWWRDLINHVAEFQRVPQALWMEDYQLRGQWANQPDVLLIGSQTFDNPDEIVEAAWQLADITHQYVCNHPSRVGGDAYGWWDGVRTAVRFLYEQQHRQTLP